jgi:hypothetical protein
MGIVQKQTLDSEPTVEIVGIGVEVEVEIEENTYLLGGVAELTIA